MKQLRSKPNLRKVFISTIKHDPALVHEISNDCLLTKPTCYTQFHKLVELRLINRIYVMPIFDGTVKNDILKNKFIEWTKGMPDNLKRYFLAKTSFWLITDYGKEFAKKALEFEQEFKGDEEYNDKK